MQIKGAIRFLAIMLAIICIYYLSFTWVTQSIGKDAKEFAQGDPNKEYQYMDSLSGEVVYNLGIRKYTLRECQEREINLGLDLKGGMNVILEISVEDIIKAMSNNSKDTTFQKAIVLAKQYQKDSREDFLTLFGRAFETVDPNARMAAIFNTVELKDKISFNATNKEVLEIIRQESKDAIDNSFNILRSRIDRFGVVQPNIQRLEQSGRIMVELPGVKDQKRVRDLLQGTANLEFWETYNNTQVYSYILQANEVIYELEKAQKELNKAETESTEQKVETEAEKKDSDELSLIEQLASDSLKQDTTDLAQSQIAERYPLFSVLRPSINSNTNAPLDGPTVGMAHFSDTGKVNKYLSMKQVQSVLPRDLAFKWDVKPYKYDESKSYYELYAIKITGRDGKAPLDGDVITDARSEFDQSGSAEVSMSMNSDGAKIWARLTKNNIDNFIAVVLDDYVYSAPRVNTEIPNGRSIISGDFTVNEAKDLANILQSGKLPAPARIIQEEIVGPSLGKEAINAGLNSFLIAFVLVMAYMVFWYSRQAGLVADLALLANLFFIFGVLASLGAVLTLPGIAGIVLTLGMAVDANVIIYERIREEVTAGKGIKIAVKDGFKNSYSAIIDGNLTTLITAVILYIFGTGPIKGFATTLIIGIISSLFTAIFLTRLIFEWYLDRNKQISFTTKLTQGAFRNIKFNWIGKRKIAYVVSAILIIISFGSLFTRGLNMGIDFTGGRTYVVRFDQSVSTVNITSLLKDEFGTAPEVKTFGADNQVKVTTKYKIDEDDVAVDTEVESKLYNGLKPILGDLVTFEDFNTNHKMSSQKVGATIADDIIIGSFIVMIVAIIFMFLYIFIRFKSWKYGLGAVAALLHDVIITLGVFSLLYGILPFSLEIDQAFIAAILTVVGYSVNDTVIVFDRIREYRGLYPKRKVKTVMNDAINDTIPRTFNTSFTTLLVILLIFIFGGEVIRGFVFALMIGILIGTYSSVFVASPVVYDSGYRKDEHERENK
ncbi:MAG: protein translocase subunit SecDF [Bacteroidetes bacterium GWF2_33_16]|nr:MAG: protein translocase subunit SecDF [Bacteroidetes bacterium GWE2_32_14]OFY05548.1 MAG: protein translocase subunit SecDF [Bacteroidetes bacterium GWF2_33_16]